MRSTLRAGTVAAATALAATLLVAGCSASADDDAASAEPTQSATATSEATEESGPAEIPDVTNLVLETAQGNLLRLGLEVEVVDEAGAPASVEDTTAFTVTAQDPAEGTAEPGDTVTLTVSPRG